MTKLITKNILTTITITMLMAAPMIQGSIQLKPVQAQQSTDMTSIDTTDDVPDPQLNDKQKSTMIHKAIKVKGIKDGLQRVGNSLL